MKIEENEEEFPDSKYEWRYNNRSNYNNNNYNNNSKVVTYKVDNKDIQEKTQNSFQFRTAESFLNNLNKKKTNGEVDLSKYKVGQRIFHKKFGEGTITKLEKESDDIKVDIQFDKVGHKRLMAKFAGLEILE